MNHPIAVPLVRRTESPGGCSLGGCDSSSLATGHSLRRGVRRRVLKMTFAAEEEVTAAGYEPSFFGKRRQKEPGGAFEPFGLPDPPGPCGFAPARQGLGRDLALFGGRVPLRPGLKSTFRLQFAHSACACPATARPGPPLRAAIRLRSLSYCLPELGRHGSPCRRNGSRARGCRGTPTGNSSPERSSYRREPRGSSPLQAPLGRSWATAHSTHNHTSPRTTAKHSHACRTGPMRSAASAPRGASDCMSSCRTIHNTILCLALFKGRL